MSKHPRSLNRASYTIPIPREVPLANSLASCVHRASRWHVVSFQPLVVLVLSVKPLQRYSGGGRSATETRTRMILQVVGGLVAALHAPPESGAPSYSRALPVVVMLIYFMYHPSSLPPRSLSFHAVLRVISKSSIYRKYRARSSPIAFATHRHNERQRHDRQAE